MPEIRSGPVALALSALMTVSAIAWQTTTAAPTAGQRAAARRPADPRAQGQTQAVKDPGTFGWLMFVYLAWPNAADSRGVPDVTKPIGAPGPTVWETWKSITDVYLADGGRPAPWTSPFDLVTHNPEWIKAAAALGQVDSPYLHYLAEATMIDGRQIVDAQSRIVQYDVRMNRDAFSYIVNNPRGFELFNLNGQQAALADATFAFNFPAPALEVKAAWRIMEPGQDDSRYWTSYGIYTDQNGHPQLAKIGLTGLHIISKILPQWMWLTFEQVDNPTATFQYFEGQKGAAVGPNRTFNPAAAALNATYQAQLAGTKWQYYGLQGWQYEFVDKASGAPTLLANTQAETYFQATSSCITCHSLSSIGPSASPRLNFWNSAGGNLVGYTGTIDFQAIARQQYPGATFKPMDYAWSLRNARPKATPKGTRQ